MQSNPAYSPWERTEADDLNVLQALDNASENQLAGFVDELLAVAEKQTQGEKAA